MLSGMNAFDFKVFRNSLTDTETKGVSFRDQSLKLDKAEDAKEIVKALNAIGHLDYFDLSGNTLGVEASKAIAEALEKHPEFKRALWKDMFTGRMKNEIPQSLNYLGSAMTKANCHLYELDLSENAFGEIAIQALTGFLTSKSCYTLKELRLNNNGLGISGGKALASALRTALEASSKLPGESSKLALNVFIAGRNRLEDAGTSALAAVFKDMKSLREIQMPQNGIRLNGFREMFGALRYNKQLLVINFNDNTVKFDGGKIIAGTLECLSELECLDLGDCLLEGRGALVIAKALARYQKKLKRINFDSNELKLNEVMEILELVCRLRTLEKIDLNGNNLLRRDVQKVQQKAAQLNRAGILGSFSENEDSDDEEAGDHDDDNGDDEGGEYVSDQDDDEGNGEDIEYESGEEVDDDDDDEDDDGADDEDDDDEDDDDDNNGDNDVDDEYCIDEAVDVAEEVIEYGDDDEDDDNNDNDEDYCDDDYESGTNQANEEDASIISNEYEKIEMSEINENEILAKKEYFLQKIDSLLMGENNESSHVILSKSCEIFMKIGSFFRELPGLSIKNNQIFTICEMIIRKILNFANRTKTEYLFTNILLVYLRLIKNEDKSFKITWNLAACYKLMLRLSCSKIFNKNFLKCLQIFLNKTENKSKEMMEYQHFLNSLEYLNTSNGF